jgi:RNA polymerase sigma factor (sigma-70 family)
MIGHVAEMRTHLGIGGQKLGMFESWSETIGGILTVAPLAVIAISGAYYAFPETYRKIAAQVAGTAAYFAPPDSHPTGGSPAPLDQVFATAMKTIPEAELTILTFPAAGKAAFTARKRLRGDWSRLGNQYVYIDRYSGEVLRVDLLDRMPDHSPNASPERSFAGRELQQCIVRALGRLSPRERMVFELKHYHGMRLRTVAGMLNTTEGTIKNTLFRATHKLRTQLAEVR